MKSWFVVYTKHRQEKRVANELKKIGIDSYCPTKLVERQWSDRKKKVEVPLFTSYCFVKLEEKERDEVFLVSGVVRYLLWLKKPAVIREEEICEIKRWLNDYDHDLIETRVFQNNDRLIIKSGLFIDNTAIVLKQNGNQLVLQLEKLGFNLSISQTGILIQSLY